MNKPSPQYQAWLATKAAKFHQRPSVRVVKPLSAHAYALLTVQHAMASR